MMMDDLILLFTILLFVLVHVFGGRLAFLSRTPRSIWLSAAGGVSVAYVFVHLLPELAAHQETLGARARDSGMIASLESHAYLIALIGLIMFYGLERLARSVGRARGRGGQQGSPLGVFWVHLGAFALYNVLIGYLLVHREEADMRGLLIYAIAMGLHFVVNDQGLRAQHGQIYHRYGRWLLAAAPVVGVGIGIATRVSPLLLSALFALLAGGVVLNVLKEELPEERESRFSAFTGGAGIYAALLLLTA
ncbi:hypothetical protein [Sphingosinicella rhizophila]|uniref:ZIP Zinc transporter n=1 Tax=Sphingosinicella rhizophila TaxID=3050082 RepID=A0ABU3Q6W8_9SPHN|nr:hypothetical protein [Sphingosinicella sp. GR2756]MDT9599148.1 hypothetical protein [Sphingosinicella sp. GR2756]